MELPRLKTAGPRNRFRTEIAAHGYDLSLNRYKEMVQEAVEHRPPMEILAELATLEESWATALI